MDEYCAASVIWIRAIKHLTHLHPHLCLLRPISGDESVAMQRVKGYVT
jgi:hypothetical protein